MLNIPPPLIDLEEFRISYETGFLPINKDRKLPLHKISNPYYAPWEDVISDLPALIQTGDIRQKVNDLPVLSVEGVLDINDEAEWQRAYLILAFLTHAYIWGGEKPEDKLPPCISCPILQVSARLELPPCATYAALNLWNFTTVNPSTTADDNKTEDLEDVDLTNPDNLYTINSLTGTDDERWFLVVSVAMEACGAKMIPLVLDSIAAIRTAVDDDAATTADINNTNTHNRNTILTNLLNQMGDCIDDLARLLERMYERNDPMVFYHQIRPLLAGSKNMAAAGLPNGVFYDIGEGKGEWHQYSGGSNAQSSLIQLFDMALGIQHIASGEVENKSNDKHTAYMKEARNYMPGPHRRFLEYVASVANIRPYALSLPASSDVRQAYNAVIMKLGGFRDKHIQIVSRYVINPASQPAPPPAQNKNGQPVRRFNLASATSAKSDSETQNGTTERRVEKVFYGTGGTDLIPFLKSTRDETKAAARYVD